MKLQFSQWIAAAACVAATFTTFTSIYFWYRSRMLTRERFAFGAAGLIASLITISITSVLSSTLPLIPIVNAVSLYMNLPLSIPERLLTLPEMFFIVTLILLLIRFLQNVHNKWVGPVTLADHERRRRSQPNGILICAKEELHRTLKRLPEQVWEPTAGNSPIEELGAAGDSLAWFQQAAELMALSSSSIRIDMKSGWNDRPGYWIGTSFNERFVLIVIPVAGDTPIGAVLDTLNHVTMLHGDSDLDIHIAVRGCDSSHLRDLSGSVSIHTEQDLLRDLVDWSDYFTDIRQRFAKQILPESHLTLNDVYVHPKVGRIGRDHSSYDLEEMIQEWLTETSCRQLALLGEYGMGKSTSALAIAYRLIENQGAERIPILIELRGKSPRNLQPLELLGSWCSPYRISPRALMRLHSAGKLVFIFEGFDEMSLVGDQKMRLDHFASLWLFCFVNSKILITGRPNFFLDEQEMRIALGLTEPRLDRAYCEALRLCPFDIDQISASLSKHSDTVRTQIVAAAVRNSQFHDLVSRPSILHVAAAFWEKERLEERADRLNASDLMGLFVRSSYRRQGAKEDRQSAEFMMLTETEREFFMTGIAAYMYSRRLPNQVSSRELSSAIEGLIEIIPESLVNERGSMAGRAMLPLRERISRSEYGAEQVKVDVRTCGLIVDDPGTPGTFRFGHKSICEFLFASLWVTACSGDSSGASMAILRKCGCTVRMLIRNKESLGFFSDSFRMSVQSHCVDGSSMDAEWEKAAVRLARVSTAPYFARFMRVVILLSDNVVEWCGSIFGSREYRSFHERALAELQRSASFGSAELTSSGVGAGCVVVFVVMAIVVGGIFSFGIVSFDDFPNWAKGGLFVLLVLVGYHLLFNTDDVAGSERVSALKLYDEYLLAVAIGMPEKHARKLLLPGRMASMAPMRGADQV